MSLDDERSSLRKDLDGKNCPKNVSHGFGFKISLLTLQLLNSPICSSQTMKRETPPCTPGFRKRKYSTASMTVEASIVLPMILCLLVTLIFFMRILTLQHEIGQIMDETVREGAIYGTPVSLNGKRNLAPNDFDASLQGLLSARFYQKVLESDIDKKEIQGGVMGLNLLASHVDRTKIRLTVNYAVNLELPFFGQKGLRLTQTAATRRWVGWNPSMEENDESRLVYVTPNGRAYHLNRSCSYLNIRLEAVSKWVLPMKRSNDGSKYYACPFCKNRKSGTYYIANYGNRYHKDRSCPAIKRSVRQMSLKDARAHGYHACSKCGGS